MKLVVNNDCCTTWVTGLDTAVKSFSFPPSFTFSSYNLCHSHSHLYQSFSVGHNYVQDSERYKASWSLSVIVWNNERKQCVPCRTDELIHFNCNVLVVLGVTLLRYQTDILHFLGRKHSVDDRISLQNIFYQDKVLHTRYLCGFLFLQEMSWGFFSEQLQCWLVTECFFYDSDLINNPAN